MIEQPIKIKPDGNGFTLMRFQENGPWKREFLRGGIVFPRYDIRKDRYSGCIAVCGSSLSGKATLYRIERFEKYDFQLAELFRSVYRDFGVDRYYYRADGSGDEDARKFEIQSGLRKRRNADSVYPVLVPLKFPTDYHALESFLLHSGNGTLSAPAESLFAAALSEWDVSKDVNQAPDEIRCTAYTLAGIDRDFEYYRRRREEQ